MTDQLDDLDFEEEEAAKSPFQVQTAFLLGNRNHSSIFEILAQNIFTEIVQKNTEKLNQLH